MTADPILPWQVVMIAPRADDWDGVVTDLTWFGYTVGLHDLGLPELWCSARSIEGATVDLVVIGTVLNRLGQLLRADDFPWGGLYTYDQDLPVTLTFWIPGGPAGPCSDPGVRKQMQPFMAERDALIVPLTWSSPIVPDPT